MVSSVGDSRLRRLSRPAPHSGARPECNASSSTIQLQATKRPSLSGETLLGAEDLRGPPACSYSLAPMRLAIAEEWPIALHRAWQPPSSLTCLLWNGCV